jgi:hypothetical protein
MFARTSNPFHTNLGWSFAVKLRLSEFLIEFWSSKPFRLEVVIVHDIFHPFHYLKFTLEILEGNNNVKFRKTSRNNRIRRKRQNYFKEIM